MKSKKTLFVLAFVIFILFALTTKSNAGLNLNNLDFEAQINSDGSMDVTETWDIDISSTNTLYKVFKTDSSKYTGITNVNVSEIGKGDLHKANSWSYHLEKDYYYGGKNNSGKFEICWGTGLENSSATKTYKISYTVLDAVAKYNDCAELYWQFVGEDFEIDAKNVTGTITLPYKAETKEDIRVWGHIETLNGEIYATGLDKVEFKLNKYSSGRYIEVRIAMPTEMIENTKRIYNENKLESIISEETAWADEANARRQEQLEMEKTMKTIGIVVGVIILALLIMQTVKYIKILKETEKLVPTKEYEYFREKPDKGTTPADALFLYNKGADITYSFFGKVFSATLLNLSLKKYFKISMKDSKKGKEELVIEKTDRNIEDINYEEKRIAMFVTKAMKGQNEITIKELQKYISTHGENVSSLIENTSKDVKNKSKNEEKYDVEKTRKKMHYTTITIIYFMFALFLIIAFPISIMLIVNAILAICINKKISRLTQKGIDEREKWVGLKKYMEDFSLLNEKEIPALALWEEYLVYATVFGIADKVIKQLKLVYPEINEMDNFSTTSYIYLMSHTDFNSSFNSAISSSISSAMSSGSGRRRRLLWRWRRWPEAGGGGRRKIEKTNCRIKC